MDKKEKLFNIIDNFCKYSVLVVGDVILDEYILGKASRLSPEAPVPVLEVERYSYILGGAGNVANNISALGGKVYLSGIIGDDHQADLLTGALTKANIDVSTLIKDEDRPTTVKTRLLAHNHQQLARADRESRVPINVIKEDQIIKNVSSIIESVDLVLLSDYAKGVLTPSLIKKIVQLATLHKKRILVDPKGLDYTKYAGAWLITPNRHEAETATKSPVDTSPEILAKKIQEQLEIENILITLGENGILYYNGKTSKTMSAVTSEVYDVTGAGDSLIATIALSVPASNEDVETSIILGNYSAGVAVRKIGTSSSFA